MSEGYLLLPNTARLISSLSQYSLVKKPTKSTSFGFLLVSEIFSGKKAYQKHLINIYLLICRQPSFVGSQLRCRNTWEQLTHTKTLIAS